jgi:hypothetical protein
MLYHENRSSRLQSCIEPHRHNPDRFNYSPLASSANLAVGTSHNLVLDATLRAILLDVVVQSKLERVRPQAYGINLFRSLVVDVSPYQFLRKDITFQ